MQQPAIIGVDIGTTGCRAVVYLPDGACLANRSAEYPLYTPHAAWAEQDPEEIYQAFVRVVRLAVQDAGLAPEEIAGLCFSTVFHSFLPVDAAGSPLYRLLIWADGRSQPYTEQLKHSQDGQAIYSRTGCPLHPMYPLAKILWLRNEQPAIFARTAKFASIKEFLLFRLTGRWLVDRSIASGSGLYNFNTMSWDSNLLNILGISTDRLSEVCPTTHTISGIKPDMAELLGLAANCRVVLGAGDGAMSNIGSGVVRPGQLTAMVGTSGAVRMLIEKPLVDPQRRTWCYNLSDRYWMAGAAINNGGIALRWVRDTIADIARSEAAARGVDPYEVITSLAAEVPAGADGLILLPLFTGERAPYWNANARGVLFGLHLNHDKRHIVRATLEGVIYRMYSIFTALEDVAGQAGEIRVSGSFTRSPLWLSIMADVFGREIAVPGEPQGSAFGAAAFGMVALGMLPNLDHVGDLIHIKRRYQPNPANHVRYQELFTIYQRIYRNLQQEFHDIAAIQRQN